METQKMELKKMEHRSRSRLRTSSFLTSNSYARFLTRLARRSTLSFPSLSTIYILNTPQVLSFSTPLFCPPHAICNPMPSTLRVCSGGMIPSSHNLADPNVASLSCSIRAFSAGSTFLPTASMTDDSCSAPMTEVFALGQVKRRRGEYARPLGIC
jgi:hypothetical protein